MVATLKKIKNFAVKILMSLNLSGTYQGESRTRLHSCTTPQQLTMHFHNAVRNMWAKKVFCSSRDRFGPGRVQTDSLKGERELNCQW